METSFIMKLNEDVDLMSIRCSTREQRIKWMEGIRALISLSNSSELSIGEESNPVRNYSSFLIANARAALSLTSKFRGMVKNIDSNSESPIIAECKHIGKLALVSITIITHIASAPLQSKTSQSEFTSCLNSWFRAMNTVMINCGELPQMKSVYIKVEELLSGIISATRPTVSTEMSYYLNGIIENIKDLNHCVPGISNPIGVARYYAGQFSRLIVNLIKSNPNKYKSLQSMTFVLGDNLDSLYMIYMDYIERKDKSSLVKIQNQQQNIMQQIESFTNDLEEISGNTVLFQKNKSKN